MILDYCKSLHNVATDYKSPSPLGNVLIFKHVDNFLWHFPLLNVGFMKYSLHINCLYASNLYWNKRFQSELILYKDLEITEQANLTSTNSCYESWVFFNHNSLARPNPDNQPSLFDISCRVDFNYYRMRNNPRDYMSLPR